METEETTWTLPEEMPPPETAGRNPEAPARKAVKRKDAAASRTAGPNIPAQRMMECAALGPFPLVVIPNGLRSNQGIWGTCCAFLEIMHQPVVCYLEVAMPWLWWAILGPYVSNAAHIACQLKDVVYQDEMVDGFSQESDTIENLHKLTAKCDLSLAQRPQNAIVRAVRILYRAGGLLSNAMHNLVRFTNEFISSHLNSMVANGHRFAMLNMFANQADAFEGLFLHPVVNSTPASMSFLPPTTSWPPFVRENGNIRCYTNPPRPVDPVNDTRMRMAEEQHPALSHASSARNLCVREHAAPLTTLRRSMHLEIGAGREKCRRMTSEVAGAFLYVANCSIDVLTTIITAYETARADTMNPSDTAIFDDVLAMLAEQLAVSSAHRDAITARIKNDFPVNKKPKQNTAKSAAVAVATTTAAAAVFSPDTSVAPVAGNDVPPSETISTDEQKNVSYAAYEYQDYQQMSPEPLSLPLPAQQSAAQYQKQPWSNDQATFEYDLSNDMYFGVDYSGTLVPTPPYGSYPTTDWELDSHF